jgi:hypothetical protein
MEGAGSRDLRTAATTLMSVLLWRWVDGLSFADADKKPTAHLDVPKLAASIVDTEAGAADAGVTEMILMRVGCLAANCCDSQ